MAAGSRPHALTQRPLSQLPKCTPRNVTGLVEALQELGLVIRKPAPSDRRATPVTITTRAGHYRHLGTLHRQGAAELFQDGDDQTSGLTGLRRDQALV